MAGNWSENSSQKYIFSRLLFIPEGGFPNSVMLLLRALLFQGLRFIPETLRTRAMEFVTDPPRVPSDLFSEIPVDVWECAGYRDDELSLLRNNREMDDLASSIEKGNGNKEWLKRFLDPELLKRYNGREAGQIPRLGAGFAALEAREYRRFAKISVPDDKELTIVSLFGTRGGTGNGLSQASAIAARHTAQELGVNVKLIGIALSGPYRPADGSEQIKEALEYALLRDIEDSMEWNAHRIFPIGPDETLERMGPLWDAAYRIEASPYMAHNEAAAMNYAAQILLYLFFTRTGYELRKNLGNEQMQLTVADLARANETRRRSNPRNGG
jgi:hypothetical protein